MITDLASGWKQWFADDFSVSVTFPGDYRVVDAVSKDATLSCYSGNGRVLLEVLRMATKETPDKDLLDGVVDAYYTMAEVPTYQNWRVVSREDVDAGEAARGVRFECAFTEQGHPMYMILLFRGRDNHVANVALKAVAADREENAAIFEQILASFETLYLTAPFEPEPDEFLAWLSPEERRVIGDLQPGMCEAAIASREAGRKVRFFDAQNPSAADGSDVFDELSVEDLQRLAESVRLSMQATHEKDQEKAGSYFRRAFELNPYDDTSIISYAITLTREGDMREAIKWAARAVAVNPGSARTRKNYQAVRSFVGDLEPVAKVKQTRPPSSGDLFDPERGIGITPPKDARETNSTTRGVIFSLCVNPGDALLEVVYGDFSSFGTPGRKHTVEIVADALSASIEKNFKVEERLAVDPAEAERAIRLRTSTGELIQGPSGQGIMLRHKDYLIRATGARAAYVAFTENRVGVHSNRLATVRVIEAIFRTFRTPGLACANPEARNAQQLYQYAESYWELSEVSGELDADGERLYKEGLAKQTAELGADSPALADALLHLAEYYARRKRKDEARATFSRVLEIRVKAFGESSQEVSETYRYLQRYPEFFDATEMRERVLAICEQKFGPVSAETGKALARFFDRERLERAIDIMSKSLAPDDSDFVAAVRSLDLCYGVANLEAKTRLWERILALRDAGLPADHELIYVALKNLAELYEKQRRYADAQSVLERAVEIGKDKPGAYSLKSDLERMRKKAKPGFWGRLFG